MFGFVLLLWGNLTLAAGNFVYHSGHRAAFVVETPTIIPQQPGVQDTLKDTTAIQRTIRISDDSLDAPVIYKATDSLVYDVTGKKIWLYGEAEVKYENITLQAPIIIFDWAAGEVRAKGIKDSSGQWIAKPQFSEGERSFTAESMRYNFKSKKGKIYSMSTQEGEGYILSEEAKKDAENNLFARKAKYTTCDLDHPHFYIEASPVKIIPNEILVSGPSNLVIAGVRTPLVLPFALFPLKKGQRSGLIVPEIGESRELGFALQNGGYYFGISDYVDMAITGDLYTSGSYRLRLNTNFVKRYRYNGNLSVSYGNLRFGDVLEGNLNVQQSFSIRGSYRLNEKAWPNNQLSANINIVSSNHNRLNEVNPNQRLNNTFTSAISYAHLFKDQPFNFNMSMRHSQNTSTRQMTVVLPEASFGVRRITPFRRKISAGNPKWYESIGFSYALDASNTLTATDSNFFEPATLQNFKAGLQHRLPVNANFKLLKYLTLTPSINYTENWYFQRFDWRYAPISLNDVDTTYVQTDTFTDFNAVRYFNFNASLTTRLYGRLNFKKGPVKAIRHVVTPSVSFNYTPDFGADAWGYYQTIQSDPSGNTATFPTFPTGLYGQPPRGLFGGVSINIGNNLEMKVRNRKDTVDQEQKIKILEAFNISTSYNLAADSLQWSPLRMSGRTTILEKLNVNFNASFDPYILQADGTGNLNRLEWTANKRLARLENAGLNVSFRLASSKKDKDTKEGFTDLEAPPKYLQIPWNLSARYSLNLNRGVGGNPDSVGITQSLGFDIQFTLLPSWRVSVSSGYDFVNQELTYTVVNINRDLHCWQMSFNWVPIGFYQSYTFGINVKSSILKDLKLEKKSNPFDNFGGI